MFGIWTQKKMFSATQFSLFYDRKVFNDFAPTATTTTTAAAAAAAVVATRTTTTTKETIECYLCKKYYNSQEQVRRHVMARQ